MLMRCGIEDDISNSEDDISDSEQFASDTVWLRQSALTVPVNRNKI